MIYSVFSVLFFIIVTAESRSVAEIKQWMITEAMSCSSEVTVSKEEMKMLLAHKIPDNKHSKCFIACVFKKVGWMDDKGMYDEAKVQQFATEEYADDADATKLEGAKKIYSICKTVNDLTDDASGCERASSLAKCLLENAPKVGFKLDF